MLLIEHLQFLVPEVNAVEGEFVVSFDDQLRKFAENTGIRGDTFSNIANALEDAYVTFCHKASIGFHTIGQQKVVDNLEAVIRFYSEISHHNQLNIILYGKLFSYDVNPCMEIDFVDERFDFPENGSVWQHVNGNTYIVEGHSNSTSVKLSYPPTVHYRNSVNNDTYSKSLHSFYRKMEKKNGHKS
jgi:hypothetical protein